MVTGASGFLGGALARRLRREEHDVVALVRRPETAHELRDLGVDLRVGDITDGDSVRAAMRGADAVFHVAGWYHVGVSDAHEAQRVNVEGTRVVLEAMRDLAIPRGVYTSTVAIFGDTRGIVADETYRARRPFASIYDRSKWEAHALVAEPLMRDGLPLVIVQPGVIYGIGDHSPMWGTLRLYLRGRLPAVPATAAYSWGHLEDTVDGHLRALARGRPGESYVIAGPAHSLMDALRIAESVTGVAAPRIGIPRAVFDAAAALAELVRQPSEGLRVASASYLGSSAKAERELGFRARSLAEGFAEVLPAAIARGL